MMKRSEIYQIAAKCLVLDDKPDFREGLIRLCNSNSIDWLEFVDICSNNLVLPLVYLKFRDYGILEFIPEEVKEHLAEIYELNRKRNIEIIRQIKSIVSILNEKEIYPVFMKGSGNLIDNLYSDIGERLMGDIDFLVPEKDYLKSVELMLDNGYRSMINSTPLWIKISQHYPRSYHPDYIADIEIHRIPVENKSDEWFNGDILLNHKKVVQNMPGCFVESFGHRVIHNFIHSQLDHQGSLYGIVLLKEIYDLYLLSKYLPLIKVLDQIKHKKKAIAYFAFARFAFGLDKKFFPKQNISFFILKWKFFNNLNSPRFEKINDNLAKFYLRFIKGYMVKFFKLFYSVDIQRKAIRKISSREFYVNLFRKKSLGDATE